MLKLEDLKSTCVVQGLFPQGHATIVSVQWFGSDSLEVTYKDANGNLANMRIGQPHLRANQTQMCSIADPACPSCWRC